MRQNSKESILFVILHFASGFGSIPQFSLKNSVQTLVNNQILEVPSGNYNRSDCGINITANNVVLRASHGHVIIDCSSSERHFIISGSNVTIEGFTLRNGSSYMENCNEDHLSCPYELDGGCMIIFGNQTTIRNSSFQGCRASQHGGAISIPNEKTVVWLQGDDISECDAAHGGAIWSRGLLTLDDCTLASNAAGIHGGAVSVQGPRTFMTVRRSIFRGNAALGGNGGAISMMVSNKSYSSCLMTERFAPDGSGLELFDGVVLEKNTAYLRGGAIGSQEGFTIAIVGGEREVRIVQNSADYAGAIAVFFSPNFTIAGNVTIAESASLYQGDGGALYMRCRCYATFSGEVDFRNNTSSTDNWGYGAAAFMSDFSTLNISGRVSFAFNQALSGSGGAIYMQQHAAIAISGSVLFFKNQAQSGGAIAVCFASSADISGDVRFEGNEAMVGGALDFESGSHGHVRGRVALVGNRGVHVSAYVAWVIGMSPTDPSSGGGVNLLDAFLECDDQVDFLDNTADLGGAVFASAYSDMVVADRVSFRGNAAASGGAFCLQTSTLVVTGASVVAGNVARAGGGILASAGSQIFLEGAARLESNSATGAGMGCFALACGGAAVVLYDNSRLSVLAGVVMRLNRARNLGGAILAAGDSAVSATVLLEGNTAGGNGGAIAALGTAQIHVGTGTVFMNNSAEGAGGCAYFGGGPISFGGKVALQGCRAGLQGGAVYSSASITFIAHGSTSITSNSASSSGGGVYGFSSGAQLIVQVGHELLVRNNSAGLDGGGLAFDQGASLLLENEACDAIMCPPANIGNGVCDATCLHRACNWDGGDCTDTFTGAGEDALAECDRDVCKLWFQEYQSFPPSDCQSQCFHASCDWSRKMCSKESASLASCPLFDAAVLESTERVQRDSELIFVEGGRARGYGTCSATTNPGCTLPEQNASFELIPIGAFAGSNEAIMFSGVDWGYIAPTKKLQSATASFTIAGWISVTAGVQATMQYIFSSDLITLAVQPFAADCMALVFDVAPRDCVTFPAFSRCGCGPRTLTAQQGIISEGDGQFLPGIDDCEWMIAPVGAETVQLHFEHFDMSPDYNYYSVLVEVCSDIKCSSSKPLAGSPFKSHPSTAPIMDLPTAQSGFVRVRFPGQAGQGWSGHTQARFVLHYAGVSSILPPNATCVGIRMGSWVHVSAVFQHINDSTFTASLYVNGSPVAGPVFLSEAISTGTPLVGKSRGGAALGRAYPMSAPFGYFSGKMDNFILLNRSLSDLELAVLPQSVCNDEPHSILCYSFDKISILTNGAISDAGCCEPANAVPVSRDRFLPWCITRNDNGYILAMDILAQPFHYEQSWGFCTNQTRVPGLGLEYDTAELRSLQPMLDDDPNVLNLAGLPGCARIPLILEGNSAKRNGGAIFHGMCNTVQQIRSRCFWVGLSTIPEASMVLLLNNVASGSGGAIYVTCSDTDQFCAALLNQAIGLPSSETSYKALTLINNSAATYGNDIATSPYETLIVGETNSSLIPGINKLNLWTCPAGSCSIQQSLSPLAFLSFDPLSGVSNSLPSKETVVCSGNGSQITAQFSVYGSASSMLSTSSYVHCLSCGASQVRIEQTNRNGESTWFCRPCLAGQYIIDPNRDSCQSCPEGAECTSYGTFVPTVSGSVWVISNGIYRLIECPPGHQLINSTDGTSRGSFSQDVQHCKPCLPGQYIIDPNRDICQNCPLGASCPDGVLFQPIVAGSIWINSNGVYQLQSCPPGYELVAQQCLICPASSYCPGGSATPTPCRDGLFSSPGSNSSSACVSVVFAVTYINIPIFIKEFVTAVKDSLTLCLATVSGIAPGNILEMSISESGFGTTQAISKLATSDAASAAYLMNRLNNRLSDPSVFASHGLAGSTLLSVTVTGCLPGSSLVIGTAARSIGSDGRCEICPPSYYCLGGSLSPSPCSTGSFSPAGSSNSSACLPSVFVIVAVTLPLPASNFTDLLRQKFVLAVAATGGCAVDKVSIISITSLDQGRRAGGRTKIQSQIAAPDVSSATGLQNRLSESSLNSQLSAQGLPAASLESVSVLATNSQVSGTQPWVIVLAVVGSLLVLLLAVLVAFRLMQSKNESAEEAALRKKILEVRQTLRLMPDDGFILNTERRPFWERWTEVVVLRRSHLEAAARMALFQDFDVLQFDAFCLSLEGENDTPSKERYATLCNWLLELSERLIYPDIELPKANFSFKFGSPSPGRMSAAERFRFFTRKVVKVRIWQDNANLFHNLKRKAAEFMDEIAKLCDARYMELCQEPGGKELVEMENTMQQFSTKWSRKGKALVRTFSDGVNPRRTSSSVFTNSGTAGPTLLSVERDLTPYANIVRQDHEEVRAIVVTKEATTEAEAEQLIKRSAASRQTTSFAPIDDDFAGDPDPLQSALTNEEVFLSQLYRRSSLLNDGFQMQVLRVISLHEADRTETGTEGEGDSEPLLAEITKQGHSGSGVVLKRQSSKNSFSGSFSAVRTVNDLQGSHHAAVHEDANDNSTKMVQLAFVSPTRLNSVTSTSTDGTSSSLAASSVICQCRFADGVGMVELHQARIKTMERMREKITEYLMEGAEWPLAANILDPIRTSIVCSGPRRILEVMSWFTDHEATTGLPVCRIKNKFGMAADELVGGYRDLMFCVVYEGVLGLRAVAEIQIQDEELYRLKRKMHKLYKIQRAKTPNVI